MDFAGARKVSATAGPELPGKVNYVRGNDPKLWRFGLPTYGSVGYREIYPATDVVYRGNQQQLEFDLVLRPGADPSQIRLKFDGAGDLTLDPDGALVVRSAAGDLRVPLPVVYQEAAGARKTVRGRYALLPNREVGFRLDAYDRAKPLVIDPAIVYAGQLGGGTGSTISNAIALDSNSYAYIAGYTLSSDFPTANAAFPLAHSLPDGFVSKIDPTGTTLLYSTYIGGSSFDYFQAIAVDSTGAAWVTGTTGSTDFPVLNAYQSTLNTTGGSSNAVVLKLSSSGALAYSTYLGSNSYGTAIAVDPNQNAYAAGYVAGMFPTTTGAYMTGSGGGTDGFVAKFNSNTTLVYATYLGGAGTDVAYAIAADASGNAYITGISYSASFPSAPSGGAQPSNAGGGDAFVAKLNAAGTALGYFTFLGGSQSDYGQAIAVDSTGNAYVGGYTTSTDFPATPGALQTVSGGGADGFVAKLNNSASAFTYVTYLGGIRQDYVQGLAIDGSGDAYVTGRTDSAQFPTAAAIQGSLSGNSVSLYQTTSSGSSWAPLDTNVPGAVSSISPDPATPGVLVAATESGIYRSINSGSSWTLSSTEANTYLSRSPASGSTIYAVACCYSSVYRSTDDGVSWTYRGTPGAANQIVADPVNANIAYAYYAQNGSYVLQKTTDGGATWNPATTGLPSAALIYSMAAASNGYLYVDISGYGVYRSTNQGGSWTPVNTALESFTAVPNGLAVSPGNPAVLYKSVGSGVIYTTTNGGASWAAASGTAPAGLGALAVGASSPSLVYAAASSGYPALYVSTNGGASWNSAGSGLGISSVTQIVPDAINGAAAYALAPVATAAFVSAINPSGSGLIYSTYLGSSTATYGYGIATNGTDAFVTGYSEGTFPVTSSALQASQSGNYYDAFIVRITGTSSSCSYSVSPAAQVVNSGAAVLGYTVVAPGGCAWNASSDQPSWAAIAAGASGSGSGLVSVSVTANNSGSTRAATLTIGGQTATLTQAPSSCSYTLTPPAVSVGEAGGQVETAVSAGAGCPWTVVNSFPAAVSVVSGPSGTGNGTVILNVAPAVSQTPVSYSIGIGGASLSISQAGYCSYLFNPTSLTLGAGAATGSVSVTTGSGCAWSASSNDTSWLTVTAGSSGIGSGSFSYSALANPRAQRTNSFSIAGANIPVTQASIGLQFYPLTPCRVADTRVFAGFTGTQGPPYLAGGTSRDFGVAGYCGVPANATAYSLNVTVVPRKPVLDYLTTWPTGQAMPNASTLNSWTGTAVANAALVPAGTNGDISIFASDDTDVLFDINGYFAPPTPSGLQFYPLAPCRVADTRGFGFTGTQGPPSLAAGTSRDFQVSGLCGVPLTAAAYSLNVTVVPQTGSLDYLTTWPTGQTMPNASTLNSWNGTAVANAALVPAGTNGDIGIFASDATNVLFDINGYYAPAGTGGSDFYPMTPCRVADTRGFGFTGQFGAPSMAGNTSRSFPVPSSVCNVPATAEAYSLNVTVVPQTSSLDYLTTWPTGQTMPNASTLNSWTGTAVANAALVPAGTAGAISIYASDPTNVLFDINGYFGQ
jgi:hypothetical protein